MMIAFVNVDNKMSPASEWTTTRLRRHCSFRLRSAAKFGLATEDTSIRAQDIMKSEEPERLSVDGWLYGVLVEFFKLR